MSKILRTPSSMQNEFIVPMSNLITSPWLESDFLFSDIYFFLSVYLLPYLHQKNHNN